MDDDPGKDSSTSSDMLSWLESGGMVAAAVAAASAAPPPLRRAATADIITDEDLMWLSGLAGEGEGDGEAEPDDVPPAGGALSVIPPTLRTHSLALPEGLEADGEGAALRSA